MRASTTSFILAAAVALNAVTPTSTAGRERIARTDVAAFRGAEDLRIRLHFDSVLAELRSRNVSALSPAQRANRAAVVATVAAYRDRGLFPRNYDFAERTPYFVDRQTGILCAVAYLLETTGRRDIVDRVARVDNNVYVRALAGDTAFTEWLASRGLTIDEAARIQVVYDAGPVINPYTAATVGSSSVALLTAAFNATTNKRGEVPWVSGLGVVTGVTSLALGVATPVAGAPPLLGLFNLTAGTLGTYAAVRSIVRHHREQNGRADVVARDRAAERRGVDVQVAPTFSMAGQRATGVALQVRF
jgi:hypothetical protein